MHFCVRKDLAYHKSSANQQHKIEIEIFLYPQSDAFTPACTRTRTYWGRLKKSLKMHIKQTFAVRMYVGNYKNA